MATAYGDEENVLLNQACDLGKGQAVLLQTQKCRKEGDQMESLGFPQSVAAALTLRRARAFGQ